MGAEAAIEPEPFAVEADGAQLAGEVAGPASGAAATVALMHGLTATRRYVVHGSHHLPRRGFRVFAYDARGHGTSDPGPVGSYEYESLADDAGAVIAAQVGEGRPVAAGHSMGAHTLTTLALRDPARFAALVIVGPAVVGTPAPDETLAYWDRLADGLEREGVEGFVAAYDQDLEPGWRETLLRITRQRLRAHRHPEAVAQAVREIPRSLPFDGVAELGFLDLPVLVVASHDEADPGHPYAVAEAWAESMPRARLVSEEPGQSPLAWQGGRLSRAIEEFCRSDEVRERL